MLVDAGCVPIAIVTPGLSLPRSFSLSLSFHSFGAWILPTDYFGIGPASLNLDIPTLARSSSHSPFSLENNPCSVLCPSSCKILNLTHTLPSSAISGLAQSAPVAQDLDPPPHPRPHPLSNPLSRFYYQVQFSPPLSMLPALLPTEALRRSFNIFLCFSSSSSVSSFLAASSTDSVTD